MRRTVTVCAGLMLVGLLVMPADGPVLARVDGLTRAGDLWQELDALQQYGQGGTIVIAAVLVWTLDPTRRRRLLDWALAAGVAWAVVFSFKVLIGRPRPRLGEPHGYLWPWGTWDFGGSVGVRHAWEIGRGISSDLWSMPSNHAAMAAVMSVFLARLYPGLGVFAAFMFCLVGVARVLFGAHYPSDVLIGGAIGWLIGAWIVGGLQGVRTLDWLWARLVDPKAGPAWPGVVEAERARAEGLGRGRKG